MKKKKATKHVLVDALGHFSNDDGWAMASHVALSSLMALFPFLIFATALASFLGAEAFADSAVHLIFDTWPEEIAAPLAAEVLNVLTVQRGDLLTIGVVLAFFFASNGVEALRTSLNRAYRQTEKRSFFRLRAQSLFFVLLATIVMLVVSLLLVAMPVILRQVIIRFPSLAQVYYPWYDWVRIGIAATVLFVGLIAAHKWLPTGHRRFKDILPGIAITFFFWIAGSMVFVVYLNNFADYASTYAGLASIIVALVFLYMIAAIFILGGELNAAIMRVREINVRERELSLSQAQRQSS